VTLEGIEKQPTCLLVGAAIASCAGEGGPEHPRRGAFWSFWPAPNAPEGGAGAGGGNPARGDAEPPPNPVEASAGHASYSAQDRPGVDLDLETGTSVPPDATARLTVTADVLGACRRAACGCRGFHAPSVAGEAESLAPSLCGCGHRADDHPLVEPATPDELVHAELDRLLAPQRTRDARRRRDYQVTSAGYRSELVHPADPARRVVVHASSRDELFARVAWLRELRRDVRIGKRSPHEVARLVERGRQRPLTVKDAWTEWLATQSPADRRKADSILLHQIGPCLTTGALDAGLWTLTEPVMRGLELAMLGKGYAPKTVKGAVALLAAAARLAVRTHHLEAAPFGAWTPLPAAVRAEREAAREPGELAALVRQARAVDEKRWAAGGLGDLSYRVITLALCALRNGEGAGLGWDDVDLARGTLVVRHQALDSWTRDYPTWARPLSPVKGRKKAHHMIALHPDARRALEAQRAQLEELGIFEAAGPVFPARARHAVTAWWRRNANCIRPDEFKRLVERAKLPHPERWCPHSLRHSAATLEIASGADPRSAQARTGHASLDQLEQYVHTRTRGLVPSRIPELAIAAPPPPSASRNEIDAAPVRTTEGGESPPPMRRRGTVDEALADRKRAGARAYLRALRAGASREEARAAGKRAYKASRAAQARKRKGKPT